MTLTSLILLLSIINLITKVHHLSKNDSNFLQACDLFLKNRSAIIKYNIRQLKFEGATTLYIRRLCEVFFPCLSETGKEFTKAFQDHYGCMSGENGLVISLKKYFVEI